MGRFIEGEERGQHSLMPSALDDFVDQHNPVRVVDAFIDELDLGALGFTGVVPAATGRPSYHPSTLLVDRLARLVGEFEPNGSAGLLLTDRRAVHRVAAQRRQRRGPAGVPPRAARPGRRWR
jgi:hypothetical protein